MRLGATLLSAIIHTGVVVAGPNTWTFGLIVSGTVPIVMVAVVAALLSAASRARLASLRWGPSSQRCSSANTCPL